MKPVDLIKLTPLMNLTSGDSQVKVGLIDGPVFKDHPDISNANLYEIGTRGQSSCAQSGSAACQHGTFVAGILCAKRSSPAPAICPDCTLLVRPIFSESMPANAQMPSATPDELAEAITDCVKAGARVINLSAALAQPSTSGERALEAALDFALRRGVIVVVAAGNQGMVGSSALTRHPWAIPVVSYDLRGWPLGHSNFGNSIGRGGLGAPGEAITSLGTDGQAATSGGTSAAAPFVTGAIALLWSEFPDSPAFKLKLAVTAASGQRRDTVVPPLLDAWAAYQILAAERKGKMVAA
jgi:subtilisin family serine protease